MDCEDCKQWLVSFDLYRRTRGESTTQLFPRKHVEYALGWSERKVHMYVYCQIHWSVIVTKISQLECCLIVVVDVIDKSLVGCGKFKSFQPL